jgi:hypothetical protein
MNMKHLPLVLIVIIFMGCHKESTTQTEQKSVVLGESFTLKADESIAIKGEQLSFRFDSVLNDSRSPEGGICVWAGNAAVLLCFPDMNDTVNTFLDPKEITYGNYKVKLQLLSPYPKIGQVIIPQNLYVAQFVVSKN